MEIKVRKADDLIAELKSEHPEMMNAYEAESQKMDLAVAMMKMREELGLTQREMAAKVGKPQSTIARIEKGSINTTIGTISEIASRLGWKFKFELTR